MVLALLGMAAALGWAVLMVRAPGAALELLLVTSPVVVAVWLIVMLTAPQRGPGAAPDGTGARGGTAPPTAERVRDAVLARDGGICALCDDRGAGAVAARRPARRRDPDPLARFITLCDTCAAAAALPVVAEGCRPSPERMRDEG